MVTVTVWRGVIGVAVLDDDHSFMSPLWLENIMTVHYENDRNAMPPLLPPRSSPAPGFSNFHIKMGTNYFAFLSTLLSNRSILSWAIKASNGRRNIHPWIKLTALLLLTCINYGAEKKVNEKGKILTMTTLPFFFHPQCWGWRLSTAYKYIAGLLSPLSLSNIPCHTH